MDDACRVSIFAPSGLGCTPNEPVALVAKVSGGDSSRLDDLYVRSTSSTASGPGIQPRAVQYNLDFAPALDASPSRFPPQPIATRQPTLGPRARRGQAYTTSDPRRGAYDAVELESVFRPPQGGPTPFETRHLYYRVYKTSGAVRSKQPADSNDPSIGRISVDSVPPPHTAASIMRCISKTEKLEYSNGSQLFIDPFSESPIGEEHVSILTGDPPGSTPENPMAFVEDPHPTFNKRMRVLYTQGPDTLNPRMRYCASPGISLRTNHGLEEVNMGGA